MGAMPVPVQIISRLVIGASGIRKVSPTGPVTLTWLPTGRSHREFEHTPRTGLPW